MKICMADIEADSDTEEISGMGNALNIVVEKPSIVKAVTSLKKIDHSMRSDSVNSIDST